jgi:hypothetical protein
MGRPRKLTGDALAEFYRLADAGLSLRELADRYKFTERTAINYLERRMPRTPEKGDGAVSVGTEGPQGTPDAEGRGKKEVA